MRMRAHIVVFCFFAFSHTSTFASEPDALQRAITQIHIHEVSLQQIDDACGSNIALPESKLEELDRLSLTKTQMNYRKLTERYTNPTNIRAQANLATEGLIESDCNPDYLDYLHMVITESLEEHLGSIQE